MAKTPNNEVPETDSEAFDEGADAAIAGNSDICPYPEGTDINLVASWNDGYNSIVEDEEDPDFHDKDE